MSRVLIVAGTTGYQTRAFEQAAASLGIELVYATNRCRHLDDPWRDGAVPVRFHEPERAVRDVVEASRERPFAGVVAVGDRPAVLAAHLAEALALPGNPPAAAEAATSKLATRGRLLAAGLPVPWFVSLRLGQPLAEVADRVRFPCVVKPLGLSGSRGVIRADSADDLERAVRRVSAILLAPDIRRLRDPINDELLIEGFIEGREFALEGLLEAGALRVVAIFEKPDPLDGPFFEETIYATPARLEPPLQRLVAGSIAHAAAALGLRHGPVHAECRIAPAEPGSSPAPSAALVFVLEVAPRPIGGLCARSLRFATRDRTGIPLEELVLRNARGEALDGYGPEVGASAVMMIPIPRRGHFREVRGLSDARRVAGIDDIVITAKPGQMMMAPPEGASYLGFIFARASRTDEAIAALRDAHARLAFEFDLDLSVVPAAGQRRE